jgi:hypothetical protein
LQVPSNVINAQNSDGNDSCSAAFLLIVYRRHECELILACRRNETTSLTDEIACLLAVFETDDYSIIDRRMLDCRQTIAKSRADDWLIIDRQSFGMDRRSLDLNHRIARS